MHKRGRSGKQMKCIILLTFTIYLCQLVITPVVINYSHLSFQHNCYGGCCILLLFLVPFPFSYLHLLSPFPFILPSLYIQLPSVLCSFLPYLPFCFSLSYFHPLLAIILISVFLFLRLKFSFPFFPFSTSLRLIALSCSPFSADITLISTHHHHHHHHHHSCYSSTSYILLFNVSAFHLSLS